jgi:hypothetical protein
VKEGYEEDYNITETCHDYYTGKILTNKMAHGYSRLFRNTVPIVPDLQRTHGVVLMYTWTNKLAHLRKKRLNPESEKE